MKLSEKDSNKVFDETGNSRPMAATAMRQMRWHTPESMELGNL